MAGQIVGAQRARIAVFGFAEEIAAFRREQARCRRIAVHRHHVRPFGRRHGQPIRHRHDAAVLQEGEQLDIGLAAQRLETGEIGDGGQHRRVAMLMLFHLQERHGAFPFPLPDRLHVGKAEGVEQHIAQIPFIGRLPDARRRAGLLGRQPSTKAAAGGSGGIGLSGQAALAGFRQVCGQAGIKPRFDGVMRDAQRLQIVAQIGEAGAGGGQRGRHGGQAGGQRGAFSGRLQGQFRQL